uniref:Cir_N domain-containing protein n=1 Tax=Trichuris muris TaxID=70415 RepID=A0A5S6QQA4_TRIMR
MNILPKKRWHVRTKENVAKVRRDEAAAAAEERTRMARAALAEQEARTKFLISRLGAESTSSPPTVEETSDQQGHVNLFDQGDAHGGIFGVNPEAEAEKREQREREERRIGLLRYLGEGSMEYMKKIPWYEQVPEHFRNRNRPAAVATTSNATTAKYDEEERRIKQVEEAKKKIKKKHKHTPTMDELRAERLKRERAESVRTELLLRQRIASPDNAVDEQQYKKKIATDFKQKYSTQFNPIYAKQNQR